MTRPTITIDEKTYELPRLKGGAWRKLVMYDKQNSDIFAEDFIEKRCEFLANIYGGGLTAEILLDNLYLEEIIRSYRNCASYILGCISGRIEEIAKNADKGDKKEQ